MLQNRYAVACELLKNEIETDFNYALSFSAFPSRVNALALISLTKEEQFKILPYLPKGILFSGARGFSEDQLPEEQKQILEKIKLKAKTLMDWSDGEAYNHSLLFATAEQRKNGKKISGTLFKKLKETVTELGLRSERNDRRSLDVFFHLHGLEIEVNFDMEEPFHLYYYTTVKNPKIGVYRDSYLSTLGLGPSGWQCVDEDSSTQVVQEAMQAVHAFISRQVFFL